LVNYIPERGDLVKINFDPQAGHEQFGWRPALVITPRQYNQIFGLAIFCPITTQAKGLPFEVRVPNNLPVRGVVLTDHLKSLDWRVRKVQFECSTVESDPNFIEEVLARIETLIR
jgi:mRNA interferase MazF